MQRIAEPSEKEQALFANVSFDDCKDPETMKKALLALSEKFPGEVHPAMSAGEAVMYLKILPVGSLFIRKGSEADTLALSIKVNYDLNVHYRFKNKAVNNNDIQLNMPSQNLFVNEFVNKAGSTIEEVIAWHAEKRKQIWSFSNAVTALPSARPSSPAYHKDNSSPIMIVSTQYSALKSDNEQEMLRLGGTGEQIQKHVGGGLTRMHRDESANEEDIALFKRHLQPDGLLIITGHGGSESQNITGGYLVNEQQVSAQSTTLVQRHDVSHSAEAYVSMVMQGGTLPAGSHLNVLLYVCLAAASENKEMSLAEEFGTAFAKKGISTSIIATPGTMGRISAVGKIFGDIPGAAIMVRSGFENIKVLTSKVSPEGNIIHREEKSYHEPFVITPIGCGPRNEIEECWLKCLESQTANAELLTCYVDMLMYFLSYMHDARDAEHASRIMRAKTLFLNLSNDQKQTVLENIKPINNALHICLSAMTPTSVTAFTFKLPASPSALDVEKRLPTVSLV